MGGIVVQFIVITIFLAASKKKPIEDGNTN